MATNRSMCHMNTEFIDTLASREMWVAWRLVAPIHYILGTPGHLLLLVTFYKRYKEERAYMYQVFATVSEFLELQVWVLLVLTVHFLSGSEGDNAGAMWYRKCYFCMWYAAKLAHATYSTLFTCSLLLSVAMTADRLYAMAYPLKHQDIMHTRHQVLALVLCLVISASTGFADSMRYSVQGEGGIYEILAKEDDVAYPTTELLGHLRNAVRIVILVALITLNLILLRVVHGRFTKVGSGSFARDNEEVRRRRDLEKRLFLLTLCQSIFQGLSVLSSVMYFSVLYASPYFAMCIWSVFGPMMDIIVEICDLLELYFTFLINRQIRRAFINILLCFKKKPRRSTVAEVQQGAVATTTRDIITKF